ncbi:MAG: 2-succinyl-5-enolpyruvyl-6-hydroxy-3-cyclohexene-1-carboxylic-acid synthase [bacterium]|nr:2-succinyl-5-enolpyruvyl-6-hydroxy-3-cyclohexene-1-carboxylic-acid synthase [bacterium]
MIETIFGRGVTSLNCIWAGLMVEELVRNGVTRFFIAPGSRSSPLTTAAARNPRAETIVHFDERGLAFCALGDVSVNKKPAVLICSSGTAAANFLPAVIETSKKKLPMILMTADRPPELRDSGALQTIQQVDLYGQYARWHSDVPTPDTAIKPEVVLTTIDQAVFRSLNPMPGPVHLNCMFREPLTPEEPVTPDNGERLANEKYLDSLQNWVTSNSPYTRYTTGTTRCDITGDSLVSVVNDSQQGVIAVGKLRSPEECREVIALSEKLGWPIFPDIVSGLRTVDHPNIIHYYHHLLTSETFLKQFRPDTVLHLGGRMTSKRWYQWVEAHRPRNYITVLGHHLRNDPLHTVTVRVKSTVSDFVQSLLPAIKRKAGKPLPEGLQRASTAVGAALDDYEEHCPDLDEIAAARLISRNLPAGSGLFLSNSMPVRDMDMFAVSHAERITFGGNRGASGIDGIIATSCGFASALNKPVTLMIGDLAFLHDLNSLALAKQVAKPLVIVLINNDGGGIFSFLPIAQSPAAKDIFIDYFSTPHGLGFAQAAKMFGLKYHAPATLRKLEETYRQAINRTDPTLIEIRTNREENTRRHKGLLEKTGKIAGKHITS